MKRRQKNRVVFSEFPVLETEHLYLREITHAYSADIFRLFTDPAVIRYLDFPPFAEPTEADEFIVFLADRFRREWGLRWGLIPKELDTLIGTCGYNIWEKRRRSAEIGYDLLPAYQRQGLMTEALRTIIEFGFSEMGLRHIEAYVIPENTASEQLLRRLHFDWSGRVRELRAPAGKFVDLYRFVLERTIWLTAQTMR